MTGTIKDIADLCMKTQDLIRQGRQLLLDLLHVLEAYTKVPFRYEDSVRVQVLPGTFEVYLLFGGGIVPHFYIPDSSYVNIAADSLSQPKSDITDEHILAVLKSLPEHLKRLKNLLTSEHNMLQKVIDELKAYLDLPEVAAVLVSERLQKGEY